MTKNLFPFILSLLFFQITNAQQKNIFEGYKLLRSDENEEFWQKNKPTKPFLNELKIIPLNKSNSIHLTIGGQVRTRYEALQNDSWSTDSKQDKGIYGHRLALHTGLQFGKHIRFFGELYHGYYARKIFA